MSSATVVLAGPTVVGAKAATAVGDETATAVDDVPTEEAATADGAAVGTDCASNIIFQAALRDVFPHAFELIRQAYMAMMS